jgi:hypothetical protein
LALHADCKAATPPSCGEHGQFQHVSTRRPVAPKPKRAYCKKQGKRGVQQLAGWLAGWLARLAEVHRARWVQCTNAQVGPPVRFMPAPHLNTPRSQRQRQQHPAGAFRML